MNMQKLMRAAFAAGVVTGASVAFAADITVHAPNGVGNVTELVEALTTVNAGTTSRKVLLEPGVYDLKDVEMKTGSHLSLTKTGCWLIGTGKGPEDVVLKGGGQTGGRRVLALSGGNFSNYCNVSNVTITGGWTSGNGGGISGHAHARAFCCVISNNYATGSSGGGGGGMFKGIARNCLFADNVVSRGISGYHWGGGMWTNGDVNLGVGQGAYDCVFTNNFCNSKGGGFHGVGEVVNCTFIDNVAKGDGGGVSATAWIADCTFVGNEAANGGAASAVSAATNCVFRTNGASASGGALYGSCSATNCTFVGNTAVSKGGALGWDSASADTWAANCRFEDNVGTENGGAVSGNGQTLTNCRFIGNNRSGGKGAVAIDANLVGCVISNYYGRGYVLYDCNLKGCQVVDNTTTTRNCPLDTSSDKNAYTNVNCLFLRNVNEEYTYIVYSKTLVNCSIISNRMDGSTNYGGITRACPSYNTVLTGNKQQGSWGEVRRTYGTEASRQYDDLVMTNCVFSTCEFGAADYAKYGLGNCRKLSYAEIGFSTLLRRPAVPRGTSPLVNAAFETPWILKLVGDYDIYGASRMRGGKLDIGAAESVSNPFLITIQ